MLSLLQEGHAQKALALLRQQLHVQAQVRRDGVWATLPAGGIRARRCHPFAAGRHCRRPICRVEEGSLLVDQSALTGESAAVSVEPDRTAYAGAMVRGGEATGDVTATGTRTFFGKTAELVRTARRPTGRSTRSSPWCKNLFVVNAAMVVIVMGYAHPRDCHSGTSCRCC